MKKQILTMFTGLFIGAIITGGASAYAAGILAERSSHRIFVDGQEVQMEAYQMVNRADVGGKYQGTWQTATASWVTIIRRLWNTPTLPKTGY